MARKDQRWFAGRRLVSGVKNKETVAMTSSNRRFVGKAALIAWMGIAASLLHAGTAYAAQQPAVNPVITFEDQAVALSGLTPGGQVAYFSIAREEAEYAATIVRRAGIATAVADGTVVVPLGVSVALKSIWVVVDLSSGSYAAQTPTAFPLRQVNWRAAGLLPNKDRADQINEGRAFVVFFVARPQAGSSSSSNADAGAWMGTVGDGSTDDDDGAADGQLTVSIDRLQPLGSSGAPPAHFQKKDVVAMIDPTFMEVVLVQAGTPQ
jgi:hypothetical protein